MTAVDTHAIVFDTDSMSANFSQQLCAFVTAQYDKDELGAQGRLIAREAESILQYVSWYAQHVRFIDDEDDETSWERPAAPWPTPGRFYDGYGKYHDDTPEVRAALGEPRSLSQFSAFESVGIFLDELPPEPVVEEMVERAKLFCQQHGIGFKGYRLVTPRYEMRPVCVGHDEVCRG